MPRLTELSINCECETMHDHLDMVLCSKPLKSLEYHRRMSRLRVPLDLFLLRLLISNSNLEHLKIIALDNLVVTRCLYEKLMSSNLKTCYLDIGENIIIEDLDYVVSYLSTELKTTALPSLTVCLASFHKNQESDVLSFLQCFPNLHHLQTYCMSPNILQSLFKYQVNIFCVYSIFNNNMAKITGIHFMKKLEESFFLRNKDDYFPSQILEFSGCKFFRTLQKNNARFDMLM